MSRLPLSHGHGHLTPVERRIACERCGREFGCSRDSIAGCWCNAEPYRLPMPSRAGRFSDCLCPNCLREFAASSGYLVPQPGREQPERLAGRNQPDQPQHAQNSEPPDDR